MDAYADRREATSLTHRQTLLIVLGVLLPTFMGSLDQTILATALPPISWHRPRSFRSTARSRTSMDAGSRCASRS
jgi:hypothetical protein